MTHFVPQTPEVADRLAAPASPAEIAALAAAVAATPEIDPILVAVLRETIEQGAYRVDARRVARKMVLLDGI